MEHFTSAFPALIDTLVLASPPGTNIAQTSGSGRSALTDAICQRERDTEWVSERGGERERERKSERERECVCVSVCVTVLRGTTAPAETSTGMSESE